MHSFHKCRGILCFPFFPVIYSAHDQDCCSGQIDRKYRARSSSQKLQLSLSGLPGYNQMKCSWTRLRNLVAGCSSLALCLSFSSPGDDIFWGVMGKYVFCNSLSDWIIKCKVLAGAYSDDQQAVSTFGTQLPSASFSQTDLCSGSLHCSMLSGVEVNAGHKPKAGLSFLYSNKWCYDLGGALTGEFPLCVLLYSARGLINSLLELTCQALARTAVGDPCMLRVTGIQAFIFVMQSNI